MIYIFLEVNLSFLGVLEFSLVHSEESSLYQCEMCSYTTSTQKLLNKHLKIHSGRPYECKFCQKTFRRKEHLKTHSWTHTGDRPYVCKNCGRKFLTKQNYQVHVCRKTIN